MQTIIHRRLIIGCGTGRCGTESLMKYLNSHADISVLHEGLTNDGLHHLVPWYDGEDQLWSWFSQLEKCTDSAKWYGDVGLYFLPYVPKIVARCPNVRVICLERNKRQVVKSYLRKTPGRNHWFPHDGAKWRQDPVWDVIFPVFSEPDKARALEVYWDYYHIKALEYRARFPRNFMLVPTVSLNYAEGRRRILTFIDYDGKINLYDEFRSNRSDPYGLRKILRYPQRMWNYLARDMRES